MNTPLISQACHVKKPVKPKKGPLSEYAEVWDNLEQKICEFHVTKHQQLIDDVCSYIRRARPSQDIHTVTLRFGSNVADQTGIFEELASQLGETTELICRLSPIDCISLTSIIQKLFHDFIDCLCPNDAPRLKKSLVTFENLVQIFKFITKRSLERTSNDKEERENLRVVTGTKLIIIIEDVTSVNSPVLEDFCLILKNHLDSMETCLVFGMSSTSQAIHKMLSYKCSSCLSIRTFTSPPVPETLAGIFELLVLNREFPFKLSPEVFYWLSDHVLYHDFSLVTLLHILKVALTLHLQHIEKNVLAALFDPKLDREVGDALWEHHETDLHLEELARAFVALENSKAVIFRDCYLALQQDNFLESAIFKKVEQTLKFLSTDEILERLKTYIELVEEGRTADQFLHFCERLSGGDLEENLAGPEDTDLSNLKSRFELQDKLRQAAQMKRTTKLNVVKSDIICFLKNECKTLKKPSSLRFYKTIYIRNARKLSSMFAPAVRSRVHEALATPSKYLKCNCCQVKPTELKAQLPPISVAYKLHLECGKMINVYDWLQSFQVVKDDTSQLTIAQFLRAVRELQILGYVKPTTRKTDHCQRLTWGSC